MILHAVAPARFGGLESVVICLAAGHRARGHDVHVAAILPSDNAGHPFLQRLKEADVPAHHLIIPGRSYLRERRAVADLCGRLDPAVLHTHGYRPDVVDSGVGRRLGIATVTTVHGFTGGDVKNRFYEWLQRFAFRHFDAVIAVSEPLADSLAAAGLPSDRIHLVPNAWAGTLGLLEAGEARGRLGVANGQFHVGWVGRLTDEKGPDVLIDALPHLAELPLTVSILGEGEERPSLEEKSRNLGIADRIIWHGAVPDAGRFFPAFDVFVLSSRREGTPIVLLEAIEAGVPVVATAVGGVPGVVGSGGALLVPPEDPEALAGAIREVYFEPDRASLRARSAKQKLARDFSGDRWLARYEEVYAGVLRPD